MSQRTLAWAQVLTGLAVLLLAVFLQSQSLPTEQPAPKSDTEAPPADSELENLIGALARAVNARNDKTPAEGFGLLIPPAAAWNGFPSLPLTHVTRHPEFRIAVLVVSLSLVHMFCGGGRPLARRLSSALD
jgi:hypothetical protein